MVIDMKVNGEIISKKEKEFYIIIKSHGKVIDMKVIGGMIKERVKEFIILMMVVDMKVILEMIK